MSLYYIFIVKDISSNFDFAIWFVTNFVGCHFLVVTNRKIQSTFFEKYNFEYRSKYFGYLFVPLLPIKMVHYSHGRETIE